MQTEINHPDLFFRFQLIALIDIPYKLFLESGKPEEAILAMLSNFQGEKPEKVLQQVVQTIVQNTENDLDKQKHLQQLQVMGQLRNFEQIIDKVMESESLQEYVSIERTWFYKQGVKAAEAKAEAKAANYEKLLNAAEQRHKEDEEARRKDEEARRKEVEQREERLIASLLLNDAMAKERVAALADVPLQKVEETIVKMTKTRTLLMTNILTFEEIAAKMQVSVDFVKTVANAPNSPIDNA
jgi:uncharacterized protein (DUF2164 family)